MADDRSSKGRDGALRRQRRVQRRNAWHNHTLGAFVPPAERGRGHRSAMSLPSTCFTQRPVGQFLANVKTQRQAKYFRIRQLAKRGRFQIGLNTTQKIPVFDTLSAAKRKNETLSLEIASYLAQNLVGG